jgi:MYXO-CTERM domain-containing protein
VVRPTLLVLLAAGAASADPPPGSWWHASWSARREISLESGTAVVPAGYSWRVTVDHLALGGPPASFRVVRWTGSAWQELDRVLDPGSAWNRSDTTLWFKLPVANPANTSLHQDTFLYYRNSNALPAPDDPEKVFLFYDDFEAPTLTRWSPMGMVTTGWGTDDTVYHRGARSLRREPDGSLIAHLLVSPPLNVADVMVESYWRMRRFAAVDASQMLRYVQGPTGSYGANLIGGGWQLFEMPPDGGFNGLTPRRGAPVDGVWTRVSVGIYGTKMRVYQDGVQINPLTGAQEVGTAIGSGSIALEKYDLGADAGWWVDDLFARPWVDPEPTTTLGAEELRPTDGGSVAPGGPRFTSAPTGALTCTAPWSYQPTLEGVTAPAFSVRGSGRAPVPEGLTVDPATGAMAWTPRQQDTGRWVLDLVVDSPQGALSQPVDLVVTCDAAHARAGCGCAAAEGAGWVLLAAAAVARARRRPRAGVSG